MSFDKDIEGNPFTATSLKAEQVATEEITSDTKDEDLYVRLSIPGSKKYVSVDTTLYTRQGIQQILGYDGIGYKLTTDTLVYNDNLNPAKHVFSTKPDYLYHFRFTLDPSAADNEGKLTIEVKTPKKDQTDKKGSKFVTKEQYDKDGKLTFAEVVGAFSGNNYLSWTLFENGSKYLSTSVDKAVVPPFITFKAGNYAEIENGAYYWSIANKYYAKTAEDGDVKWVANPYKGLYNYAADKCDEDAVMAESKKVYAQMANYQWSVVKNGKGSYELVNREFSDVSQSVKLYDLGNNTYYAPGLTKTEDGVTYKADTIKLVPVEGADKFVGYKNFSDKEAHELVFGLKVASGIADAFVGGLNDEGVLKLVKASDLEEEGVQKFTLEKVGKTFRLNDIESDSLVYNVYALKAGKKYLVMDESNENMVLGNMATNAYTFKATEKEGEYKMFIYKRVMRM